MPAKKKGQTGSPKIYPSLDSLKIAAQVGILDKNFTIVGKRPYFRWVVPKTKSEAQAYAEFAKEHGYLTHIIPHRSKFKTTDGKMHTGSQVYIVTVSPKGDDIIYWLEEYQERGY
jgi:hypothetical protein